MERSARGPVERATHVAGAVLAPNAARVDAAGRVPAGNLRALAGAGLFGLEAPPAGAAAPTVEERRRVQEILAGACGATYFVWLQHRSPLRLVAATSNRALRDRYLDDLRTGRLLAGVAYSHLRRREPTLVARRRRAGYEVTGTAPWVTSWGTAGAFAVAAALGDEIVWFLLPGGGAPGVAASAPMPLGVMQAGRTVSLSFERVWVHDRDVVTVEPLAAWRRRDEVHTVQPNPAAYGLTESCVRELRRLAASAGRRARTLRQAADLLESQAAACRGDAYALADAAVPVGATARRRHLAALAERRARGLDLGMRAARTLFVGTGAAAVLRASAAGRMLREASFWAVFGQVEAAREPLLALQTAGVGAPRGSGLPAGR